MPRRAVTAQLYNDLLAAFRDRPGEFAPAARRAICDERTAKKAWVEGWPALGYKPIRQMLESEQEKTRAELLRREVEAARQLATADAETKNAAVEQALKARAEVGEVLKGARAVALGTLAAVARITPGVLVLADRIREDLKLLAVDPRQAVKLDGDGNVTEWKRFSTKELLAISESYMRLSTDLTKQAGRIVHMERQYLGLPTEIIGVQDMSLDEAIASIDEAYAGLNDARSKGLIALDGGKARNAPPPPPPTAAAG